jgi:hypothetical protein
MSDLLHVPFLTTTTLTRRALIALPLAAALPAALAQFRVEIAGVGATQLPIAVLPFRAEAAAPQPVGAIVRANLERSAGPRSAGAFDYWSPTRGAGLGVGELLLHVGRIAGGGSGRCS